MSNPGVTIETYLKKVKDQDINVVKKQMEDLSKQVAATGKVAKNQNKQVKQTVDQLVESYKKQGRQEAMAALRRKIATNQIGTLRNAWKALWLVVRDATTATGLMNTMLNIAISRFGSMLIVFGIVTMFKSLNVALKEATEQMDTAIRKVASLVVPTTNLHDATKMLTIDMIKFAIEVGGSFEQLSDTQFLLASAGLKSLEIHDHFANVQKLVIATAKDLNATLTENKQIVEVVMGIYNNFKDTMVDFNNESEKTAWIAAIIFDAYRRNQILLTELASGMTYAAAQARAMGVSVEELIYTLAFSNTVMIKGSKAGTSYANAMRDVSKNAVVMNKAFGIDMRKLGKDFSFLEEVIKPVSDRIKEAGVSQKLFLDLLAGVGARGTRTILGLAPHYDELRAQIDGLTDRQKALDEAINIATGSYKMQRQVNKNLWTVVGNFFAIAITGGMGYNKVLKTTNNILRDSLKPFAALAVVTSVLVAIVMQLASLVVHILISLFKIAKVVYYIADGIWANVKTDTEGFDEALVNATKHAKELGGVWENFGRGAAGSIGGIVLLSDIMMGEYDTFEEVVDEVAEALRGARDTTEEWAVSSKGITKQAEAYLATLNKQYEVIQNTKEVWDDMSSNAGYFVGTQNLKIAFQGADVEELMTGLASGIEEFFAGAEILDSFFGDMTKGWKLQERNIDGFIAYTDQVFKQQAIKMNENYKAAMQESQFGAGEQTRVEVIAEYYLKLKALANNYFITITSGRKRFLDKEADSYEEQGKQIVEDLKDRWKSYAQVAGSDLTLYEMSYAGLLTLGAGDITFDADLIPGLRDAMTEKVKELNVTLETGQKILLQTDIDEQGLKNVLVGKERKDELRALFDTGMESIAANIVDEYNLVEEEAIDSMAEAVQALFNLSGDAEAALALLTSDSKLPEEIKLIDKFWDSLAGKNKDSVVLQLVNRIKKIRKERDKMIKGLGSIGDEGISIMWGKLTAWFEGLNKAVSTSQKLISIKMASIADSLQFAGDSFQNFADIVTDDMTSMVQLFAGTTDAILQTAAGFVDMLHNYKQKMQELENLGGGGILKTLTGMSFGLGIIGLISGAFATITALMRNAQREKESLEEEFQSQAAADKLSPDYGQARVINQRISLQPVFQFLEPSQLTEVVQRRIAQMVYNQIKELQKSGAAA